MYIMASEISALPNEVQQTNNVVMKVTDKVEANVQILCKNLLQQN